MTDFLIELRLMRAGGGILSRACDETRIERRLTIKGIEYPCSVFSPIIIGGNCWDVCDESSLHNVPEWMDEWRWVHKSDPMELFGPEVIDISSMPMDIRTKYRQRWSCPLCETKFSVWCDSPDAPPDHKVYCRTFRCKGSMRPTSTWHWPRAPVCY